MAFTLWHQNSFLTLISRFAGLGMGDPRKTSVSQHPCATLLLCRNAPRLLAPLVATSNNPPSVCRISKSPRGWLRSPLAPGLATSGGG
ncbi:hypothetical protein BD310DRAFT_928348 [Dichomitus squalens]|uniref:Uncharacterized protein n=1 Tax=Dichomitus squalens TaxID=114155 RepID=A0A4Q9PTZ1_9APHY|nr:hypothetical protein BD310DRAFT_928348 [Dichomitus squalens]